MDKKLPTERNLIEFLWILACVLLMSPGCFAQADPNLIQGTLPYVGFSGGELDKVNLGNGNLFFRSPLVGYPQRGTVRLNFVLQANNKQYALQYSVNGTPIGWTLGLIGNEGIQPSGVRVVDDQAPKLSVSGSGRCGDRTYVVEVIAPDDSYQNVGALGQQSATNLPPTD